MSARSPAPDFRHLTLWPASGARFGDGTLNLPKSAGAAPEVAKNTPEVSPRTQG